MQGRSSMKTLLAGIAGTLMAAAAALPAVAQAPSTLTIVREVDADRYDPARWCHSIST
jgi:hypothetical protein